MPVVAVNLPVNVHREVSDLVARGEYASPEDFLITAAFNQLALEKAAMPEVPVLVQPTETPAVLGAPIMSPEDQSAGAVVAHPLSSGRTMRSAIGELREEGRRRSGRSALAEDGETLLSRLAISVSKSASATPMANAQGGSAAEQRIWGQVNRLFPIKFAVRWLSTDSTRSNAWPEVEDALTRMSSDAAVLGSYLEEEDQRTGRQRDDQLATGLPRRGNAPSLERFRNQIVARLTRAGDLYSGAIIYCFLAATEDGRLGLTELGAQLTGISNPVMDAHGHGEGSLSAEERAFFINLIQARLPVEGKDARNVLTSVRDGHTSPESLQLNVRSLLPAEWTDVMARTHTSGLVSRMADMGLLKRRWAGRTVRYELTDASNSFLG